MTSAETAPSSAPDPDRIDAAVWRVSLVVLVGTVMTILGPTIGGVIIQNVSWRWIFYVNVPIGVLAVVSAVRVLPWVKPKPTDRLDLPGLVLMATGVPLVIYGLAEIGSTATFTSPKVI